MDFAGPQRVEEHGVGGAVLGVEIGVLGTAAARALTAVKPPASKSRHSRIRQLFRQGT